MNQENGEDRPETLEEGDGILAQKENYGCVVLGQIAGDLIPYHPGSPETTDEELSRAALSDVEVEEEGFRQTQPTPWRIIFLLIVAAIALAIVFWN